MKLVKAVLIIGVAGAGLLGLLLVTAPAQPDDPRGRYEKVKAACDEQYPGDSQQAADCTLEIAMKDLRAMQDDKLKRAYDASH